jgi:hypothetical protein
MDFFCFKCGAHFCPQGHREQIHLLLTRPKDEEWPCPRCEAPIKAYDNGLPEGVFPAVSFYPTPEELCAGFAGMGMPTEEPCTAELLRAALLKPIKAIDSVPIPNTTRLIVRSITFTDNSSLFFGAGPLGAVLYRYRAPFSYVEQLDVG